MDKQEIINEDPEPDAAARQNFLNRVRGHLPGLPRVWAFKEPAREVEPEMLVGLEGHFAIVPVPSGVSDRATLTASIEPSVDSLLRNDYLNEHTAAEARRFAPENEDSLEAPAGSGPLALDVFKSLAAAKGDVPVYRNDSPLTPTKGAHSPVNRRKMWRNVSIEHANFDRQIRAGRLSYKISTMIVGLMTPDYTEQLFGDRLVYGTELLEEHQPVVLTWLGTEPRDLVLAPPFPRGLATGRA